MKLRETLIQKIQKEARDLADLQQKPDLASRLRLYAKVAGWMKELPPEKHDLINCPVCNQPLVGRKDLISEKEIADHIKEFLEKDSEYLEKTAHSLGVRLTYDPAFDIDEDTFTKKTVVLTVPKGKHYLKIVLKSNHAEIERDAVPIENKLNIPNIFLL